MSRPRLNLAALTIATALFAATLPMSSYAQATAPSEQIDEKIAYVIGTEAVYYGMGQF